GSLQRSYDAAYAKYKDDQAAAQENYELQKLKVANLEGSSSAIINAQFGVDTAQAKLDAAVKNQAKTSLLAPTAGQIAQISGKPGDSVSPAAEQSGASAASLLTITEPTGISLTSNINEGDIAQLAVGQVVKANIEALGLIGVPGKVSEVSRVPKIDNSGIVSYEVTAVLDEANETIFDGMSAFITYIKKEKADVLMISNKAIFIEEGQQYVQVQTADGSLEKRAITAGLTNGSVSEIMEGLAEGENVVTSGSPQ
ncbi:MAG TPA: HlyD family efflux transporter periplasmic adaptor subunit, partial [Thioalkalivibrio sp.]|nr:HlyD family efflux transporter periplasmic adaptor subunit [Thioalkalivibrio sp.]